jgi:hypothetical protein
VAIRLEIFVVRFPIDQSVFLSALSNGIDCSIEEFFLREKFYDIVDGGLGNVVAGFQKDLMRIIALEAVKEDRVIEMPVVASQIQCGCAGPTYLAVGCSWWWWRILSVRL